MPRRSKVLHRLPACWEQVEALTEILHGPQIAPLEILEAIADEAVDKARLPVDLPHPQFLALASGIQLLPVPGLQRLAVVDAHGVVLYRPRADRRRLAFALYHEIAECLLARSRWPHTHADVQLLTLMLMVPRAVAEPLRRRMGLAGASRLLVRRHRHAPAWAIRMRMFVLASAIHEAAA